MKKTSHATAAQGTWAADLAGFDKALRARGMAEKTRKAYGVYLGQLAEWATGHGVDARSLDPRMLRRFAGVLSERGASKTTVGRKLAAIRTFFRYLVERGELEANPADLVATPKRDSYLPRVLKPGEVAEVLERIPARSPLELRDRALFELAYGAGLRAEELVNLDLTDLDPDAEELRVTGKGSRTRVVPAGEPAWPALERYLERGRPALASRSPGRRAEPAGFGSKRGPRLSTSDVRPRLTISTRPASLAGGGRAHSPRAPFPPPR